MLTDLEVMQTIADVLIADPTDVQAELTVLAIRTAVPAATAFRVARGDQALHVVFPMGTFPDPPPALPQLILLELQLPVMNGLHVLDVLRRQPTTRHIPVVLFTSVRDPFSIESSYALGASGYVVKPQAVEEYVDAVQRIIERWLPAGAILGKESRGAFERA